MPRSARSQALAKLQLKLPDFRRLCILKGVHPREPAKKVAGKGKTYYHVKDVALLQHEPLLATFRAMRTHRRKARAQRRARQRRLTFQLRCAERWVRATRLALPGSPPPRPRTHSRRWSGNGTPLSATRCATLTTR